MTGRNLKDEKQKSKKVVYDDRRIIRIGGEPETITALSDGKYVWKNKQQERELICFLSRQRE